jgi:hypothetical protein
MIATRQQVGIVAILLAQPNHNRYKLSLYESDNPARPISRNMLRITARQKRDATVQVSEPKVHGAKEPHPSKFLWRQDIGLHDQDGS